MVSKPIDTAGNPKPIMPLIMPAKAKTTIIIAKKVTVYLRFLKGYATEKTGTALFLFLGVGLN